MTYGLEYALRVLLAGLLGGIIGYERKNRMKEAGIRTHFIVALGAALIMIVSKYGFSDTYILGGFSYDPSKIASNIVSGVGFLGAGLIFVRKHSISGLTTAAGVWATAAVGMAVGAGMYFIATVSTIVIIIAQVTLHSSNKMFKMPYGEEVIIRSCNSDKALPFIEKAFKDSNVEIINMKIEKLDATSVEYEFFVKIPKGFKVIDLVRTFNDSPLINFIEF